MALAYLAAGFQAFVLRYTIGGEYAFQAALEDVSGAVKLVREHAAEWHLDPDKIAVCGFSAGGHLAAASGTLAAHKPNALILGYPCILESMSRILAFPVPSLDQAVTPETLPPSCFTPGTIPRCRWRIPCGSQMPWIKPACPLNCTFLRRVPTGFP